MGKGDKHSSRKTRIQDHKKSKHYRESVKAKLKRHGKKLDALPTESKSEPKLIR